MKKFFMMTFMSLMTCMTVVGQNMFSGSTDLEVIANEWENVTLRNVPDGSLATMLDCFNKEMAHMDVDISRQNDEERYCGQRHL